MSKYTTLDNWNRAVSGTKPQAYTVTKALPWDIGTPGSGLSVEVPVGFQFDVSIPWFLRWLLSPKENSFRKAACLHDYLLVQGWDRVTSGGVFSEALKADKVPTAKRFFMVIAVVSWGWK